MFCSSNKFKQQQNYEYIFPEVKVYKYLGVLITSRAALTKHFKPVETKMLFQATRLAIVRSDKIPPQRLMTLFFVVCKALLDYPGTALHVQKKTLKERFVRLANRTFRIFLGLRKSSPVRVINQLIVDPTLEWERRHIYYCTDEEERKTHERYQEIMLMKKMAHDLRKDITWQTIRIANIPVGAKGTCALCKQGNLGTLHVFSHLNMNNYPDRLPSRLGNILAQKNSLELLKKEKQEDLLTLWLFYKANFTI